MIHKRIDYCLFPPVAESTDQLALYLKLKNQLAKQIQYVPSVPLSLDEVTNGQVTHWLPSYIQDVLYSEMCKIEKNRGEKIKRYYVEAAKYVGRISAGKFGGENAKYKPVFNIYYKDFTARLQAELELLMKESPNTLMKVVQNAVFRIFKARHELIFYDYIEHEGLSWRFVSD